MLTKRKIIIILSIIIMLAGASYFYYGKNNKILNSKLNNSKAEKIDTSDWLTYRNEEYGFEIKYPKDWVLENPAYKGNAAISGNEYHILGLSPDKFKGEWAIVVSLNKKLINELLNDPNYITSQHWKIKSRQKLMINNLEAERVIWTNDLDVIFVQNQTDNITLKFESSKYKEILNKILFTLKFVQ